MARWSVVSFFWLARPCLPGRLTGRRSCVAAGSCWCPWPISGRWLSIAWRNQAASRQCGGRSKLHRRPTKYSTSSRAVMSGRAGARKMRGTALVGEGLERGIVAFASVGHAYQARIGRGDQQRACRAVDGAGGGVQDAVLLGRGGQPVLQLAQAVRTHAERPGQVTGSLVRFHRELLSGLGCLDRNAGGRRCHRRRPVARRRRCRR